MKTLKGMYMEEVEIVLENLQRNSQVTIIRESGNAASFSLVFEDEALFKKMEDMFYYASKDYGYDYSNSKYDNDFDDDYEN